MLPLEWFSHRHSREHKKIRHDDHKLLATTKQIRISFTSRPITAWGGLCAILSRYLRQLDFADWVEHALPIVETSNHAKGVYPKVLALFITVLTGGERFAHARWWGHGIEVFRRAFQVPWLPPDASSITRCLNRLNSQSQVEQLAESARALVRKLLDWEKITADIVCLDSSVITRYGGQEGARRGYNPKKPGRPSHHPLFAFLGSGYVVNLWNRAGHCASAQGAVDFLQQTLLGLGSAFRLERLLADSGFYRLEFLQWLEERGHRYVIAAPVHRILQREIAHLENWIPVAEGIFVAEFSFQHQDEKWDKPRRYVATRQLVVLRPRATGKQLSLFEEHEELGGYRYSLMITNEETLTPLEVWRAYRHRPNCENVIKELRDDFGAAAFNTHNFWATEAVLILICVVFKNLLHYLNRNVIKTGSVLSRLKTLRGEHFIVGASLGMNGRRQVLRLGIPNPSRRAHFRALLGRLDSLPGCLNSNAIAMTTGPPS